MAIEALRTKGRGKKADGQADDMIECPVPGEEGMIDKCNIWIYRFEAGVTGTEARRRLRCRDVVWLIVCRDYWRRADCDRACVGLDRGNREQCDAPRTLDFGRRLLTVKRAFPG